MIFVSVILTCCTVVALFARRADTVSSLWVTSSIRVACTVHGAAWPMETWGTLCMQQEIKWIML